MKRTSSCFWCKQGKFEPVAKRSDGILVIACLSCGLMQVASSPNDLEEYYTEDYYSPEHQGDDIGYDDYYVLMNPLFLLWQSSLLKAITNSGHSYSLLDVGCATGNLMEIINEYSPNIHTTGIDISDYAIDYCKTKGLNAEKAYIEEYMAAKQDIIVSLETLEHLDDLQTFVGGVKNALKANGSFMFYVPSVSRRELEDHSKLDVRLRTNLEHLIYFTPEFFKAEFAKFFNTEVYVKEFVSPQYGRSIVGLVTPDKDIGSKFDKVFSTLSAGRLNSADVSKMAPDLLRDMIVVSAKFLPMKVTEQLLAAANKQAAISKPVKAYLQAVVAYHKGSIAQSISGFLEYYSTMPNDTIALKVLLANEAAYNRILLGDVGQYSEKNENLRVQLNEANAKLDRFMDSVVIRGAKKAKVLVRKFSSTPTRGRNGS